MSRERQRRIIACLQGYADWVHGPELAAALGVSRRTLQNEIKAINQASFAETEMACIESNRRLGYRIVVPDRAGSSQEIRNSSERHAEAPEYLLERQIIVMLLFEREYVSIEHIAQRLYVSRSTVMSHFARVKRIVPRTPGAQLESLAGKGVRITASEREKRSMLTKCGSLDDGRLFLGVQLALTQLVDIDRLRHLVADRFIGYAVMATSGSFESFVQYLAFTIVRSKCGFALDGHARDSADCDGDTEYTRCESTEVAPVVSDISNVVQAHFGYQFTSAELHEIGLLLNELNLVHSEMPSEGTAERVLDDFERRVESTIGVRLQMGLRLRSAVSEHIVRLSQRLSSGRVSVGSDTRRLFGTYPLAVHMLKTCLEPALGMRVPEAELSYMVLYLVAAIENLKDRLQVLLVSDKSASSIFELERRLGLYADEMHGVVRTIPSYMYLSNAEVYEAWAHLMITSDSQLAVMDHRFTLLEEKSRSQLEMIRREMLSCRVQMDASSLRAMEGRYPVVDLDEQLARRAIETLLQAESDESTSSGNHPSGRYVARSAETIGPATLCIIETELNEESWIGACRPLEPIAYLGKRIEKVVIAHYGGETGPVPFFEYLSSILPSE